MANALKEVGDWLSDLVDKVKEALKDEAMRKLIAEDLGLPPDGSVPKPDLPQDKLDSIAAYRSKANPDKEAFIQLLNDVRAVYEATRSFVASLGVSGVTTQNQVLYRLFDLFALNELRVRDPVSYFAVQFLATLVEDSAEVPGLTTDDLAEARFFRAIALALEFACSPLYYFFKTLSTKDAEAAKRTSDRLFPHIAGLIAYLQRKALDDSRLEYGWDSFVPSKKNTSLDLVPESSTPLADELADRMLTFGFPFGQKPADGSHHREALDFTLAIVPESDGPQVDPAHSILREGGLLISVGGESGLDIQLTDRWKFLLEASAKPAFSLFLSHGTPPRFTKAFGPINAPLNVAFVTIPDAQNVTYAFPHKDETHIEIGQLAFSFSFDGFKGGIKGELRRGAIVIATKDQDGFLSHFLPKDGFRVPFNFGAGFSTDRGFFTEGNVPLLSNHSTRQPSGSTPAPAGSTAKLASAAHTAPEPSAAFVSDSASSGGNGGELVQNLSSSVIPELGIQQTISIGQTLGPITISHLLLRLAPASVSANALARAQAEVSVSLAVQLGPVAATVDRIGFEMGLSFPESGGNVGFADFSMGFKPPTGVGLSIDAQMVVGGGFLFFDPQKAEYGGVLQLELAETIAVKAVGLLTTRMPDGSKGFSLLILISAEGFAPIQLGFGFKLTGIGGLLGINRTVMVDVLRGGLKTGTLGSLLFPADPIRNAPQIVSDLRAVFPPVNHRYVFGPMVQLAWGTPTLLTLELAILLELPDPVRLLILGRLQALLPEADKALVRIRMDAIGLIDFNRGEVTLDATLYDSRILQFALTGDMALRANWGSQPNFVLAVGGLHPRFPAPAGLPQLARLALSLSDGDNLRLRCEAYFALTSNTVQFGARLDLHAAGGGFSFDGALGFDALFQLSPLSFAVDVGAALALRYHGHLLVGVSFDGSLSGPTPWHVQGKATIKLLFFKVSVHFDHQFGEEEPPPLPAPVDVLALVTQALQDHRNWSAALPRGEPPVVSLRETATTVGSFRVHPLAQLTVRQQVAPLNRLITKVGSSVLTNGPTSINVAAVGVGATPLPITASAVREPFALAQYEELSDDEKLSRPAFETQDAGLQFAVDELAFAYEALLDTAIDYETLLIDPTSPADPAPAPMPAPAPAPYTLPQSVMDAVVNLGAAGQAPLRRRTSQRYRSLEFAA
jgi:hypothetical protein